jgi:hypothetical protein
MPTLPVPFLNILWTKFQSRFAPLACIQFLSWSGNLPTVPCVSGMVWVLNFVICLQLSDARHMPLGARPPRASDNYVQGCIKWSNGETWEIKPPGLMWRGSDFDNSPHLSDRFPFCGSPPETIQGSSCGPVFRNSNGEWYIYLAPMQPEN